MLLGILSVIALSIGTYQTATDLSVANGLSMGNKAQVVAQVVQPTPAPEFVDPDMGL